MKSLVRVCASMGMLGLCGSCERLIDCSGMLDAPAAANQHRVDRDEACARYQEALQHKCDDTLVFNCESYFPEGCTQPQRESDVMRCERRIECARNCGEAMDLTCGTTCSNGPLEEVKELLER